MSYILEALQKSEQDRQNQNTPSLTAQYDAQALAPPRKPRYAWWLVAALGVLLAALVVVFLIWFMNPPDPVGAGHPAAGDRLTAEMARPSSNPPPAPSELAATPAPASADMPEPEEQITHAAGTDTGQTSTPIPDLAANQANADEEQNAKSASNDDAAAELPASKSPPVDPRIAALYSNPPADEPEYEFADNLEYQLEPSTPSDTEHSTDVAQLVEPTVVPGQEQSEPGPAVAPLVEENTESPEIPGSVVDGGFMAIEQLPDTIKSEIPPIRYIAHVYSGSNKAGFAILNDQKLEPGDKLADELYLEKVDKDHIVMSFRGYFFRLMAMQNWDGFNR